MWIINNYRVIHYYLIPLIAAVAWCGMLATMLLVWAAEGRPMYWFMTRIQDPVYISDIGASQLKPFFVILSAFQGIFFISTLVVDYLLRVNTSLIKEKGKGIIYFNAYQRKFGFMSIIFACTGQLGIVLTAVFDTAHHRRTHFTMVTIFITSVCFACTLNVLNSLIFGVYIYRSESYSNFEDMGQKSINRLNYFFKIFLIKIGWMVIGAILAILFGVFMSEEESSLSAIFEWTVAFWYAFLLIIWSLDLLPFAYVYNDYEADLEKILDDESDAYDSDEYHESDHYDSESEV